MINNTFVRERHGLIGGANMVVLNNIFSGIRVSALRRVGGNSLVAHNLFWETKTELEECTVTPTAHLKGDPRLDASSRPRAGSAAVDAGVAFLAVRGDTLLAVPAARFDGKAPDLGAFEVGGAPRPAAGDRRP